MDVRSQAKALKQKGDYGEALKLYENLINDNKSSFNHWVYWEYAYCLKKLERLDDCISVCKKVYKKNRGFKHNNDLLCWCIYEKYIKGFEPLNQDDILKVTSKIEFILNSCEQDGNNTPFERSIFYILDILKKQNNVNHSKMLMFLKKINPSKLSLKPIRSKSVDNKILEYASSKEKYYSYLTRCLDKLNEYNECFEICRKALKEIESFHYDNEIWFTLRKLKSEYYTCNNEDMRTKVIENLIKLSKKHNKYPIMVVIFNLLCSDRNYEESLIYASKAMLFKTTFAMKVNIAEEIANVLEELGNIELAKEHFLLAGNIRYKEGWKISTKLKEKLEQYNLNEESEADKSELYKFWKGNVTGEDRKFKGKILNIMKNGKSGFIKENEKSYYFRKSSIITGTNNVVVGANVLFDLTDSFDHKKGVESKEAVNIIITDIL